MSIPAPDEISLEDPLCDSSLGSMVTQDYVTHRTHKHQNLSQEDFYLCQCSITFSVTDTTTKDECLRNAYFVKTFAGRFGIGQWSFIGPGSEKKWYPSENSPQGAWDHIAEDMLLQSAESGHPIFRATTPLSRGQLKSKGRGKLSIHFTSDQDTVDTIYRIILSISSVSTEQWQPYARNLKTTKIERGNL